jgi:hypothetical protein
MNFKTFALNYLNPFTLFLRAFWFSLGGLMLFFSLPLFVHDTSATVIGVLLLLSLGVAVEAIRKLRPRPLLLFLVLPLLLAGIAFGIRGENPPSSGILWMSAICFQAAAFIWLCIAVIPWQYTLKDVMNRLEK